mmetsp:Transcript_9913/g.22538  ORF Transcript_9913/g.22538 Transcript_9913/m.22538 type:complete len:482 (-) Transcript_9913:106-1551(-)
MDSALQSFFELIEPPPFDDQALVVPTTHSSPPAGLESPLRAPATATSIGSPSQVLPLSAPAVVIPAPAATSAPTASMSPGAQPVPSPRVYLSYTQDELHPRRIQTVRSVTVGEDRAASLTYLPPTGASSFKLNGGSASWVPTPSKYGTDTMQDGGVSQHFRHEWPPASTVFVTEEMLQSQLLDLEKTVSGSMEQVLEQVMEVTTTMSSACSGRIDALEKDLASRSSIENLWHSERAGVLADIAALRDESSALRTKSSAEERSQAVLNDTLYSMSGKLAQTDTMVTTLKTDLASMQRLLKGDLEVSVASVRREMERCKDSRVWTELESCRARLDGLEAECAKDPRPLQLEEVVKRDLQLLEGAQQELLQRVSSTRREMLHDKNQTEAALADLRNGMRAWQPCIDGLKQELRKELEDALGRIDKKLDGYAKVHKSPPGVMSAGCHSPVPSPTVAELWPEVSQELHSALSTENLLPNEDSSYHR